MRRSTRNDLITVNATAVPAAMLLAFMVQNAAGAAAAVLGSVYAASVIAANVLLTRNDGDITGALRRAGRRSDFSDDAAEFISLYESITSRGAILKNCGVSYFENFYKEITASAEKLIISLTVFIREAKSKDSVSAVYIDGLADEMELLADRADDLAVSYLDYLKDPDTDLGELNLRIRDDLAAYRANRENNEPMSVDEMRRSVDGALRSGNFSRVDRLLKEYRDSYERIGNYAFESAIKNGISEYVSRHGSEFMLDPGDGSGSPYLSLCPDSTMESLLISLGAPRPVSFYSGTSFAFHSGTGELIDLKEEFLISSYNRLNSIIKTDREVFINFLKGRYYPENTAVKIMDMLNINSFNKKNLYEGLCKKLEKYNRRERSGVVRPRIPDVYRAKITGNGWDLKFIFESIGYTFVYEGTDDPFKGPGVYYIP